MEYKIPIKKEDYYKAVLNILNFSLNLTPVEIDIISTLLINKITTINTRTREAIRILTNKDKATLNNHIKRLSDKGILINGEAKELNLNPSLTQISGNKITFEFDVDGNSIQD